MKIVGMYNEMSKNVTDLAIQIDGIDVWLENE